MSSIDQAQKYYLFYDGDCGFCNFWVQWILKRDLNDRFLFSALQSDFGQQFLKDRNLQTVVLDSIYIWSPGHFYLKKSQAVLKVLQILYGTYSWGFVLQIFPTFLLDVFYDVISKNRFRIKYGSCYVPTDKEREKWIS